VDALKLKTRDWVLVRRLPVALIGVNRLLFEALDRIDRARDRLAPDRSMVEIVIEWRVEIKGNQETQKTTPGRSRPVSKVNGW
jgi:hypothetical protein